MEVHIMLLEKIQSILAAQFEIDPEKITEKTDIMNDLGADSLDLVELIMALEEEYSITITDESVYEHKTVGDIATFIESQISNR